MDFKAIRNIIKTKLYLSLSIFIVSLLLIVTLILQLGVIPKLKQLAFDNILTEAKKVSYYMSDLVDYKNKSTDTIDRKLEPLINDFNIDKIHYFDKNGKVIYSTSKEKIGYLNKYSYFKDIISKGNPYYSIKLKNSQSSELEVIKKEVAEVYIPIMEDGNFVGAFELYYDVSESVAKFDRYSNFILKANIIMVFVIFVLFSYLIHLISIKNLNEKELITKDYLTNLDNRRYFYEVSGNYILLSERNKTPFSLCMIDIDNFKQINDKYGHSKGDDVLKLFANEIKILIRKSDLAFRFGGEEFLLLLPNTDLNKAEILANKICKHFATLNRGVNFTLSIGVSEHKGNAKIEETIDNTDGCLYKAKVEGKNRVIIDAS